MGRPNRKWQLLGVAGALGLVVAVCLLAPGPERRETPKKTPAKDEGGTSTPPTMASGKPAGVPVEIKDGIGQIGDPKAKVKIEVFYPGHGDCGSETADFAYRVYEANKTRVRVLFIDFDSAKGGQYQSKAGMHCSGIAINGKQQFKVPDDKGKLQTVEINSNLGDRWRDEQFLRVLDTVFSKEYGKPANHNLPPSKLTGSSHSKSQPQGVPLPNKANTPDVQGAK